MLKLATDLRNAITFLGEEEGGDRRPRLGKPRQLATCRRLPGCGGEARHSQRPPPGRPQAAPLHGLPTAIEVMVGGFRPYKFPQVHFSFSTALLTGESDEGGGPQDDFRFSNKRENRHINKKISPMMTSVRGSTSSHSQVA